MNERINELRKTLGLTQQQFADNLKIARGNIAAYEVGKNLPSDAAISLICREFNVNESWLRDGSGDMFKSNDLNRNNLTNERIKALRKALGLTQQEFADKIGIKRTTIATYESGRNVPIDAVISLICLKFNVNETWLREGFGDMFMNCDTKKDTLIHERIKVLRNTLGLTQQQFANKLSLKRNTIATYEQGKINPSDVSISLLCREFDVNETWLREGSGDMFKHSDNMPLQQGRCCTVKDFYNMPGYIRAELISGQVIYMAAPSTMPQIISSELHFAINSYIKSKGGHCRVLTSPISVQLRPEDDTILQPDISVICDTGKLTDNGCIGAPDWIIEIVSPSNPSHDYITKLGIYHDAGVREYWTVDAQNNEIHVYNMDSGAFITKTYSFHDTVKSGIYEDLYIDFSSLDLGI
ncbi:MAG: helix-turn-helix domain-containing protein [Lachnospiraceae bacterium]|nr:helix-turn-helix domain-containing protein [Lachnospiraceae bacterium]